GLLERSPMERVRRLQEPQHQPPVLTEEELERLLAAFPKTFPGRRNRMLTLLMLDTGLRVSEAVGVRLEDIADQRLRVQGKGDKERVVFFVVRVAKEMRRYLRARERWLGELSNPWLFPSRKGRPLTRSGAYQMLQRAAVKAGLGGQRVSPDRTSTRLNSSH